MRQYKLKYWDTVEELLSSDVDVKKYIFKLPDAIAEAVLYKYGTYEERTVMCISTQTGCQMGCTFCGTGKFFGRDLTHEEITEQVAYMIGENNINADKVKKMQIMVMSMGEPLMNMENVHKAFKVFNKRYNKAMLLVSTSAPKTNVGWNKMFNMAVEIPQVGLQFSVHASTDEQRNKVMPMKSKLNLKEIAEYGEKFYSLTGRNPFFNYCVGNHNNTEEDVQNLTRLFNPYIWQATLSVICESDKTMKESVNSQRELVNIFSSKLLNKGFSTRVFDPAGQDDIGGGCGQLWAVQEYAKEKPNVFKQSAGNAILCKQI